MAHGELNLDDRFNCGYCDKSYKYHAGLRKHTLIEHSRDEDDLEPTVRPNRRNVPPDNATLEEVECIINDLANMLVRLAGIARKLGHTKF